MKPVMLMILDGWGIGKEYEGNAIWRAHTPNMDLLLSNYPHNTLDASGMAVGLPEGQMGNSEVGHLNIGAGRVVFQELTRISRSIKDNSFYNNPELNAAVDYAIKNHGNLHVMGLLSKGGVHSHMEHLFGLLELCKKRDFHRVFIHVFLDGRDVSPYAGLNDIQELMQRIESIGVGKIATISGRYYAMDRDKRWNRVELAYNAIVLGKGPVIEDPITVIKDSYKRDVTDEFFVPGVVHDENGPIATVKDQDAMILFNFRPDRARQLTRAIVEDDFDGFEREKRVYPYYVSMTEYDATFKHVHIAYGQEKIEDTLGEVISRHHLNQLRIAETEKYAHVTFFFNGGVEEPNPNEDRVLIPSPKVATYDLQPQMSANLVKDEVLKRIRSEKYDLIVLNFANSDMVGHTGVIPAAIQAVEAVDACVGEIVDEIIRCNGALLITADHGNSEKMIDENGGPFTAHTTNPVPVILISDEENVTLHHGKLSDLAPTLLDLLGIEKPASMTGQTLIDRK